MLNPVSLVLLGIAFCFMGGCASDQKVIAQADQFNSSIKPAEIQSAQVNPYMQQIGRRIQAAARQADAAGFGPSTHFNKKQSEDWMFSDKVEFDLVNSKTLNAFTTGGYHVYIYNELFQQCKTEDELAAVMAHEFGHIYCRHVHKGMNRQMAGLGIAGLAGAAGYAAGGSDYATKGASLGAMAAQFANMGFTRGDEAQADQVGFHFYYLAGWDPRKFPDFFKQMIDMGLDKTPAIESDHPTLASRVTAVNGYIAKLGANIDKYRKPDIADPDQLHRIQLAAGSSTANMPNDQQALNAKSMLQALPRSCWVPYDPGDRQSALQELLHSSEPASKP